MVGARQAQSEEQKSNSESITVEELEDMDIIMQENQTQSPPKKKIDVKKDFYEPMNLVC